MTEWTTKAIMGVNPGAYFLLIGIDGSIVGFSTNWNLASLTIKDQIGERVFAPVAQVCPKHAVRRVIWSFV